MASELMDMIGIEEYVTSIPAFPGTEYLNKTELSSLKKMISGKLWIDSRKFVSRQNAIVVNGLYALFGTTLGRNASDVRSDACDLLLDPDSKNIRSALRDSIGKTPKSYSTWINRLSSNDYPCDEFGLFLLSYVYKRHVIVILANSLWCTFKTGCMSTFQKLCKSDHILVWLGEDRYAEIKPLQTQRGHTNFVEWQLLSDSIDILHLKSGSSKRARRASKGTASIGTPKKRKPSSPSHTRVSNKRESKKHINYKQFHEDGIFEIKQQKDKFPPKSSGPSESRLESQRLIVRNKQSPQPPRAQHMGATTTTTPTTVTPTISSYVPRRNIVVSVPSRIAIKREISTFHATSRNVKQEPGIFMTRRKHPKDQNRDWRYVHVSGRKCNQGGELDCNSQSENEDDVSETLPDLPLVPDPTLRVSPNKNPSVTTKSSTDRNTSITTSN